MCIALAGSGVKARAQQDSARAVRSLLVEAHDAAIRGDFAAAAVSYHKATDLDPTVPQLWANLGLMYHQLGKSSEAIHSFKHAAQIDPTLFVPQLFLGVEYLRIENPQAAVPFLENAGRLHPNDLQVALSLGAAYAMLGRGERAAASYSRAIELAPTNAEGWLGLGNAYLQQVEENARVMTSTYGHSAYAKLRAAEVLTEEGKLAPAEHAYQVAVSSPSVAPCAHAEFGDVLLEEKKVSEARRQFQLEIESGSHCGLTKLGTAAADVAEGSPDLALKKLIAAIAADPGFVQTNFSVFRNAVSAGQATQIINLARVQQSKGALSAGIVLTLENAWRADSSAASNGFARDRDPSDVRERQPGTPDELYAEGKYRACEQALLPALSARGTARLKLLATCSFYTGDFHTASLVASHLKANSITRVEGLYWESKADEKLAVAALNRAEEIAPNSPRMHVLLGDAFRQKRQWGNAEAEYRRAVALDPTNRAARLSLAIVLFTELKTTEALQIDKSLLREIPNDPEANLLAGEILAQQHLFAQADTYLSRCKNLKPELVPRLHVLLGQVYAAMGRIPEAISEYKLGSARDDDGSIHYQLARLYLRVGDKSAAENEIRISKELRERWDNQAHIDLGQPLSGASP